MHQKEFTMYVSGEREKCLREGQFGREKGEKFLHKKLPYAERKSITEKRR